MKKIHSVLHSLSDARNSEIQKHGECCTICVYIYPSINGNNLHTKHKNQAKKKKKTLEENIFTHSVMFLWCLCVILGRVDSA